MMTKTKGQKRTLSGRAEYVDNRESELWRSWNLTAAPHTTAPSAVLV